MSHMNHDYAHEYGLEFRHIPSFTLDDMSHMNHDYVHDYGLHIPSFTLRLISTWIYLGGQCVMQYEHDYVHEYAIRTRIPFGTYLVSLCVRYPHGYVGGRYVTQYGGDYTREYRLQ